MRGKRVFIPQLLAVRGITPADAGKTDDIDCYECTIKDHPRGCGENRDDFVVKIYHLGSPPRMRGKLLMLIFCKTGSRITPADAGKTFF